MPFLEGGGGPSFPIRKGAPVILGPLNRVSRHGETVCSARWGMNGGRRKGVSDARRSGY